MYVHGPNFIIKLINPPPPPEDCIIINIQQIDGIFSQFQ